MTVKPDWFKKQKTNFSDNKTPVLSSSNTADLAYLYHGDELEHPVKEVSISKLECSACTQ